MINLNEIIEITATGYLPQFSVNTYKYDNADFFVIAASFKKIYINKYARRDYDATLHPFKAEVI